jgi:hypothetical protein
MCPNEGIEENLRFVQIDIIKQLACNVSAFVEPTQHTVILKTILWNGKSNTNFALIPRFQYMGFVFSSLLTCSIASLTVVAIDRYLFICRHALHGRLVGRRWSVGAMLASCWGVGFLTFLPTLCGWGGVGYVPQTAMCGYQVRRSSRDI